MHRATHSRYFYMTCSLTANCVWNLRTRAVGPRKNVKGRAWRSSSRSQSPRCSQERWNVHTCLHSERKRPNRSKSFDDLVHKKGHKLAFTLINNCLLKVKVPRKHRIPSPFETGQKIRCKPLFHKDFFFDHVELIHVEACERQLWQVSKKAHSMRAHLELFHGSIYSSVIYFSP